jgi:hypothetical protein
LDKSQLHAALEQHRVAFLRCLAKDPRAYDLSVMLEQNSRLASDIAYLARLFVVNQGTAGSNFLVDWREHGATEIQRRKDLIETMNRAAQVLDSRGKPGHDCREVADQEQKLLPSVEQLYDLRRFGVEPYWTLIVIEAILELVSARKTSAAELMALLDAAREARGLKPDPAVTLETFRRNFSNFKKKNQLRVNLIRSEVLQRIS